MTSTMIPVLHYYDPAAMVAWLCDTLGFERHLVIEDDDGGVAHAELTLGSGMVMLGPVHDDAFGRLQRTPRDLGGTSQSAFVIVEDADAIHDKATAAGVEVVMPLGGRDYGGREFSCRDPEGHIWSIGTYDPWKETG